VQLSDHPEKLRHWEELRVLFVGGYWMGDNDLVKIYLRSLRDLTPHVYEYSTEDHRDALDCGGRDYDYGRWGPVHLKPDHLQPVIDDHRPHLIICCAGGLSFFPAMAERLRQKHCLVGIALSEPDVFEPATSKIAPHFDAFFSNSPRAVEMHRQNGANAVYLPFACYPKYHRKLPKTRRYECDVLFVGQARPDRVELTRKIQAKFKTLVFGSGWDQYQVPNEGMLPAEEVVPAINSASVCLDFARNLQGEYMLKYRIFEFAGCGAVACTERFPELSRHFTYGKELIGYDTEDEMLRQIEACVSRPEHRHSIGQAALKRALAEHTFVNRWNTVAGHCGVRLRHGSLLHQLAAIIRL
jgi:hypothetical protein